MVSIYSLRPVYTFLYTILNGNKIASIVQKIEQFWDVVIQKNFFCIHTQDWTPPCMQSSAFGLTPPLPFCAYVLRGWPLQWHELVTSEVYICTVFFWWSIIIRIFRAIIYEVKKYEKTTNKSWKQNLVLLPVFAFLYPDFVDIFSCTVLILISIAQVPPSFYHGTLLVSRTPDLILHHPFDAVPEKKQWKSSSVLPVSYTWKRRPGSGMWCFPQQIYLMVGLK